MLFTKFGYRIQHIREGKGPNWLFLPGGPGLGSEYLKDFCQRLILPGSIILVDFPLDGDNPQGKLDFNYWKEGLLDLLKTMPNVILVAHSFAAMFILLLPEIEAYLAGLVLMNSTTRNGFFEHVESMQKKYELPDLLPAASQYHLNPSNKTYQIFWDSYKYYYFTAEELKEGEKMLLLFAFNSTAYQYAIMQIFPNYQSQWQPRNIPAMTISSEQDYICPPQIFIEDKKYQVPNVINKFIPKAGHCPWLLHFDKIQSCFDDYIALYDFELRRSSNV